MRKQTFKAWFIMMLSVLGLTACGPVIGLLIEPSLTPSSSLNIKDPLKIHASAAKKISTIAVPNLADQGAGFSDPEDARIYRIGLDVLIEELKKNADFKVTSLSTMKQTEMGLMASFTGMTQEEQYEHFKKMGKAAKSDAVLLFDVATKEVNMGMGFLSYGLSGTVNMPKLMRVELVSSETGQIIYSQGEDVDSKTNEMGFANTPEQKLRDIMRQVIKPLADDISKSFQKKRGSR